MLKKLTITNGELSVKFDPLNTRYTVKMTTNDTELNIDYVIEDTDEISIYNNYLDKEVTEVVITVYNDMEMLSYYFEVTKLEEENVSGTIDYFSSLEVTSPTSMPTYVAPLIGVACFLVILCFFAILFKKTN